MNGFDLDALLDMLVERVADRVVIRIEQRTAERAQPEMITMREFGRRHSISENTVRAMIRAAARPQSATPPPSAFASIPTPMAQPSPIAPLPGRLVQVYAFQSLPDVLLMVRVAARIGRRRRAAAIAGTKN